MPARLISVGNAVIDIAARVPLLPARGGDVLAEAAGLHAGGGGFNVLVAAARQGLSTAYGGAHGTGPFGDLVREALRREGIDVLLEPIAGVDTGWTIALTDRDGERTFVTATGAETRLTPERIRAIRPTASDAVHVSGYGLLHEPGRSAILAWLRTLPETIPVLVDPGPLGRDIPADAMRSARRRATWWSCNLTEARAATGATDGMEAARRLATIDTPPAAPLPEPAAPPPPARPPAAPPPAQMKAIQPHPAQSTPTQPAHTRNAFIRHLSGREDAVSGTRPTAQPDMGVVVRLGAEGCIVVVPGGEPVLVPGFRVASVDSNGAGDAHVGAFLAALLSGLPPLAAARRANACAAVATTRSGPATAGTRAETDALLTEH
jgi:sugar/nucleoside kinase (ribokinase family)